jgi:hypothetical protein
MVRVCAAAHVSATIGSSVERNASGQAPGEP